MAQAKALDALAPFVALAASASSPRHAADLVVRATSHPCTYVFAELLQTPQIQALATADAEYAAYLTLLQIFSYGTYADYERGTAPTSSPSSQQPAQSSAQGSSSSPGAAPPTPLPPLSDAQATKLRQLSLVSLATDRAGLGYDRLVRELRLADARQLEALVTSAVYAGLVAATLDPAHQVVRVSAVAPLRDLAPGAVPRLHAALQGWSRRCEATLAELDAQIAGIRRAAAGRAEEEQRWDAQFRRTVEGEKRSFFAVKQEFGSSGSGGGGGDNASSGRSSTAANTSAALGGKRAMTLNVSGSAANTGSGIPRFNKRGSNLMADAGGPSGTSLAGGAAGDVAADDDEDDEVDDDDEAMDVDDGEGGDGNKRNWRTAQV